jgi:hypothetical protein
MQATTPSQFQPCPPITSRDGLSDSAAARRRGRIDRHGSFQVALAREHEFQPGCRRCCTPGAFSAVLAAEGGGSVGRDRRRGGVTSCAQGPLDSLGHLGERLPAGLRDPHAHNVRLPTVGDHALTLRGCEAGLDQFDHHVD